MSEWQPIETAPHDGSAILVAHEKGVWIAQYLPKYPSGYKPPNPWFSVMLNHDYINEQPVSRYPTHWMPLPEPPP